MHLLFTFCAPSPQVPASFPRQQHPVVDNPALFRRLDPECLFFAFYFQPDSYQQFLAAGELKRQSWRFHKHHHAWFQVRISEHLRARGGWLAALRGCAGARLRPPNTCLPMIDWSRPRVA
jgi:CCR4-NOT transcriptional regulation complex NOT5 subunit